MEHYMHIFLLQDNKRRVMVVAETYEKATQAAGMSCEETTSMEVGIANRYQKEGEILCQQNLTVKGQEIEN